MIERIATYWNGRDDLISTSIVSLQLEVESF